MKFRTLSIKKEQLEGLRKLSKAMGLSQGFLIRMAIDELIEYKEKLEEIISSQRKVKLWDEFFNTLWENRLSFSYKKDSFDNVNSKG